MQQKQISFIQFLKNLYQWVMSFFDGEAKTQKQAEIRFGKNGGLYQKYSEELTAYGIMLKIGHITSMVLSFFFVYAILETPAKFMGANVLLWCSTISITILLSYEWLKNIASKRAADGFVAGWYDYTKLKPFHFLIAALLCFGSYKMCKEGSEDLLATITDKTDVITDDGSKQKKAIETQYSTALESEMKIMKAELQEIKSEKKQYISAHSWKGHIDTRDKNITTNIARYDERIADKEKEIRSAKDKNEADKKIAISEIKVETGQKLIENKGITAMYAKYGFYASIVLEILILLGHLAYASIMAKLCVLQPTVKIPSPTPVEEPEEDDEDENALANIRTATNSQRQYTSVKDHILWLQTEIQACQKAGKRSEAAAHFESLMQYRPYYNIDTGEPINAQNEASSYNTTGITTVVSEKVTPEKELIIIRDSAILSKYPDVLEALKKGKSLQETADACEVSKSIVQQVKREAKYHGLIE